MTMESNLTLSLKDIVDNFVRIKHEEKHIQKNYYKKLALKLLIYTYSFC